MEDRTKLGTFYGIYDIYIYHNDYSDVPHFHVLDNRDPDNRYSVACIEICHPRYFDYIDGQHKFTSTELESLMRFLKEPFGDIQITNWEHIVFTWNANNYSKVRNLRIPDYADL